MRNVSWIGALLYIGGVALLWEHHGPDTAFAVILILMGSRECDATHFQRRVRIALDKINREVQKEAGDG